MKNTGTEDHRKRNAYEAICFTWIIATSFSGVISILIEFLEKQAGTSLSAWLSNASVEIPVWVRIILVGIYLVVVWVVPLGVVSRR